MTLSATLAESQLAHHDHLTRRVCLEGLALADAESELRALVRPDVSQPAAWVYQAAQARRSMYRSPYESYVRARLAYALVTESGDDVARAQCGLAFAEVASYWGAWAEALGVCLGIQPILARQPDAAPANAYRLALATALCHLNRHAEALAICQLAENVQDNRERGRLCLLRARVYLGQGHYLNARLWGQRARAAFKVAREPLDVARCDIHLAFVDAYEQRYEDALARLPGANETFAQHAAVVEMASSLRVAAVVHIDRGEYWAALSVLQQAKQILEAQHMTGDLLYCERLAANAYRQLGRLDEALAIYARLRKDFDDNGMVVDVANCDMNLGLALKEQSRYDDAVPYFERAMDACQRVGLRLHAARCAANLAQCQEMLGLYDLALEVHQQAHDLFAEAGLTLSVAHCAENMGRIFLVTGQHSRALELLLAAERGFATLGASVLVAANRTHQALVYAAQGQDAQARAMLEQARSAYIAEGMPGQAALCELHLADLAHLYQDPLQARLLYQHARQEFLSRAWPTNVALCEVGLGETDLARGEIETARAWFTSARAVLYPTFPDFAWRADQGLARCALQQGQAPVALSYYRLALDSIRRGRSGLYTAQGNSAFYSGRQHVSAQALSLALELQQSDQAVEILEDSKAQAMVHLLFNPLRGLRPRRGDADQGLLAQEHILQGRIDALRERGLSLTGPDTRPSPSDYDDTLQQLAALTAAHEEVVRRLFRARPLWASLKLPPPFSLADFRAAMRGYAGSWNALTYELSGANLSILYVDAETTLSWTRVLGAFERRVLEVCASTDEARRDRIYGRLEQRRPAASARAGDSFLQQAYALLVPTTVAERLSPDHLLIIGPHSQLHNLPFHALQSPDGRYLIERTMVAYAPSLHSLQVLLARANNRPHPDRADPALVMGVSDFGHKGARLPNAPLEARAVFRVLGGVGNLLLDDAARRTALLEMDEAGRLAEYRRIHFATHLLFEQAVPFQTQLLLYDGGLTVRDVFDLSLDADLVTLSACDSALGQVNPGDEMVSLTQAFFHAGARALVAGLWRAPDESTRRLMTSFYDALTHAPTFAHALGAAQRGMIAAGYTPFHWAPFILMGHPGHREEDRLPTC